MLVTALCTACFSRTKIYKRLWPPYFECSGAGTGCSGTYLGLLVVPKQPIQTGASIWVLNIM